MVMKIYVKKIEGLTLPKKASEVSAGYDIVSTSDPKIVGVAGKFKNSWNRVDYIEYETNLYIAPESVTFHTLIHPRSSISKYNLVLANSIGLVDNDYRGMVICRFKYVWQPFDLKTDPSNRFEIVGEVDLEKIYKKGDTIAQLVFEPTVMVDFELVDDLTKTKRGEGGFGSTDKTKIQPKQEVPRIISGKSLSDMYNEAGGIPVKERYSEQIKKREVEV